MEKYQPTEKDMETAESSMTEKQKELSAQREIQSEKLKSLGLSGYLYSSHKNGGVFIEGVLNGNSIEIEKNDQGDFYIKINKGNVDAPHQELQSLFNRYKNIALDKHNEWSEINQSNYEISEHSANEIFKELL